MTSIARHSDFASNYANPFASKAQAGLKAKQTLANHGQNPNISNPNISLSQLVNATQATTPALASGLAPSQAAVQTTKTNPQATERILQNYIKPAFGQQPTQFADLMQKADRNLQAHRQQETQIAQNAAKNSASGSYSFLDVIDMINPLQHIPVISNLYRAVTGDTIRQEVRIAGNLVFGALTGPVGVATGLGSAAVDGFTGKPVGDHVLAVAAPNLENTLREEYSIASYFENPFSTNEEAAGSQQLASAAIEKPEHLKNAHEAQQVYAQTASVLGQKIQKSAPATEGVTEATKTKQLAALSQASSPYTPDENIIAQPMANLLTNPVDEAQALARSVAHNPNTVVQVSPDAAAQLASLAAGTANGNELNAQFLGITGGDAVSQLQAVAAKNRQLGIALDSSAHISQQISEAQQRDISFDISNKVAALYDRNSLATQQAIQNSRQASATNALHNTNPPLFNEELQQNPQAALASGQDSRISSDDVKKRLSETPKLLPHELGQNYHNANAAENLSIAAAMQQALSKYQNLRRN